MTDLSFVLPLAKD